MAICCRANDCAPLDPVQEPVSYYRSHSPAQGAKLNTNPPSTLVYGSAPSEHQEVQLSPLNAMVLLTMKRSCATSRNVPTDGIPTILPQVIAGIDVV